MTATIVLLDPDPAGRHRTGELLERAGFRVRPHGDAAAALAAAAALDVDAVVWAERGPEAGGLEPLRAYRRRSPAAWTPVVVLAPAGDAGAVARVLDAGADDCLPEVAAPALLVATLRARLRPRLASVLRGDLATSPFARLTQLCHRAGLTGALEVQGDRVEFAAGSVVPARRAAAARLLGAREGAFVLRATPVDLAALAEGARPAPASAASPHHPAGRLSGLRIGQRVLQIQTEYGTLPEPRVVTLVMLGGRTVHQRVTPAPPGACRADLERLVTAQHLELERSLREKIDARTAQRQGRDDARRAPETDAARARFERLHDEGLERFLAGQFAAAAVAWEEALRVDPHNQALAVNLAVARRKRDAAAPRAGEAREIAGVTRLTLTPGE